MVNKRNLWYEYISTKYALFPRSSHFLSGGSSHLEAIADEKVGEAVFSFVDAGYYALITPYTVRILGNLWRGANLFKMNFGDGVVESYALKYTGR